MKKIIITVALLFCVILTCVSCTKTMGFFEFNENLADIEENVKLTSAKKIEELSGWNYLQNVDEMFAFRDDSNMTYFYNVAEEKGVFFSSSIRDYKIVKVADGFFIVTVEDDETVLYDKNGNRIESEPGNASLNSKINFETKLDLFRFYNSVFRVDENGDAKLIYHNPLIGSLPAFDYRTDNYYYLINDNNITVYDLSLKEVYYWEFPQGYSQNSNCFLISDGKLLIQYSVRLVEDAEEYSYFDSKGAKYNLVSMILDVEEKNEKAVDLSYLVAYKLFSRDSDKYFAPAEVSEIVGQDNIDMSEYIHDDIKNLFYIAEIEDRQIHNTATTLELVSLDDNGKIDIIVAEEFDTLPIRVAEDKYIYLTASGNSYIINGEGEKLFEFNTSVISDGNLNCEYFIYNNKIYNYDLAFKYDINSEDKKFNAMLGHGVLLSDDAGLFYVYTDSGELICVNDKTTSLFCYNEQLIVTYDSKEQSFCIMNEYGEEIQSIKGRNFMLYYDEGNVEFNFCSLYENGTISYYKITK